MRCRKARASLISMKLVSGIRKILPNCGAMMRAGPFGVLVPPASMEPSGRALGVGNPLRIGAASLPFCRAGHFKSVMFLLNVAAQARLYRQCRRAIRPFAALLHPARKETPIIPALFEPPRLSDMQAISGHPPIAQKKYRGV